MNTLFSQLTTTFLLNSARKIVGNCSSFTTCSNLPWKSNLIIYPVSIKPLKLGLPTLPKFGGIQSCYYSTKKGSTRKRKPKVEPGMKDEKDAFFVVRKGDVVGVYKSLSDCQSQVGSSVLFSLTQNLITPSYT